MPADQKTNTETHPQSERRPWESRDEGLETTSSEQYPHYGSPRETEKNIIWKITYENFPNLEKETNFQVLQAHIPRKMNPETHTKTYCN